LQNQFPHYDVADISLTPQRPGEVNEWDHVSFNVAYYVPEAPDIVPSEVDTEDYTVLENAPESADLNIALGQENNPPEPNSDLPEEEPNYIDSWYWSSYPREMIVGEYSYFRYYARTWSYSWSDYPRFKGYYEYWGPSGSGDRFIGYYSSCWSPFPWVFKYCEGDFGFYFKPTQPGWHYFRIHIHQYYGDGAGHYYGNQISIKAKSTPAYLYANVYNKDDDDHRVYIYVDNFLWGYMDVPAGQTRTSYDKEVDPGTHKVHVRWYDDDDDSWHTISIWKSCPSGKRTQYYFSLSRILPPHLYVRVYNKDDDDHRVYIYVDDWYWGYMDVSAGRIRNTIDKEVTQGWHKVRIKWHDDDDGQDHWSDYVWHNCRVNTRTQYYFELDYIPPQNAYLYVRIYNKDDDDHRAFVYVDGSLWGYMDVPSGQIKNSIDRIVTEDWHNVKIKWHDDDDGQDHWSPVVLHYCWKGVRTEYYFEIPLIEPAKANLYVKIYNKDDDDHRVFVYVDNVLWGYMDVPAGQMRTSIDREVTPGSHKVKVKWHDDDDGQDHWSPEVTHNCPAGQRTEFYFELNKILGAEKEWTFIVFLDADNNLESAGINDFLEMSDEGSDSSIDIVVQMDRIPGYDTSHGDWRGAMRYRVTQGMTPTVGNAVQDLGEVNMGDPTVFVNFVKWAIDNYPAKKYAVVVWDHGSGWIGGVSYDSTSSNDRLTMSELKSAMGQIKAHRGSQIEILGFDACLMGMIEVTYQVRDTTKISIGSEETIPNDGWPYDDILSDLKANPTMSESTLATAIVNDYIASYQGGSQGSDQSVTLAAFLVSSVSSNLKQSVSDFATKLISKIATYKTQITNARSNTEDYYYDEYADLYDFADEIYSRIADAGIRSSAQSVMNNLLSARVAEGHGPEHPDSYGLTIFWPKTAGEYTSHSASYKLLDFAGNSQWDEFLDAYHGVGSQAHIRVKVTNTDDEDKYAYYQIDGGQFNDYVFVKSGQVAFSGNIQIVGNTDHNVHIKWLESGAWYGSSTVRFYVEKDSTVDFPFFIGIRPAAGDDLISTSPAYVFESDQHPSINDHTDRYAYLDNVTVPATVTSAVAKIDIIHPYIGDLRVWLGIVGGRIYLIHDRQGGSGDDIHIYLDLLELGFSGNDFETKREWFLRIYDAGSGNEGVIEGFKFIIGRAGCQRDLDCDGLFDVVEFTADTSIFPSSDLPDPYHKDIYVEVDWMLTYTLNQDVRNRLLNAFGDAPVQNPDGNDGVT
jgi:hypothetical protein